jgi:uncharacterized protein (DUF1501 family)
MTATPDNAPSTSDAEPTLVVVELCGGNDALNTVIPYNDPLYYDQRPNQGIPTDQIIDIDGQRGFHPGLAALKPLLDMGKVAVMDAIGYPNPNRSHFRSQDIWHTAEPDDITEGGWLGKAIRDLDPRGQNKLLAVNVGRGMPRAIQFPGVSAASVASVDTYGVLTNMASTTQRASALDLLRSLYAARQDQDALSAFIGQTGIEAQDGANILNKAARAYTSTTQYPTQNPLASNLRDIAKIHSAGLGTRIFYTQMGGFDTHAMQAQTHPGLLRDTAEAIAAFYADLQEHLAADNVAILVFSEFGRRVRDNGGGTDHGAGGTAFVIGGRVRGGFYGEVPSLRPTDQEEGDLKFNLDFRKVYATILEHWLQVDSKQVLGRAWEQLDLFTAPTAVARQPELVAVA